MSALREPYRVVVWGPGVMGQAAIREVLRLPETELVGVLAYSPAKDGVDVGTLIGQDRIGVSTTTDPAAIVALKPDVVLHTARDFGDFRSDDDIVMLLEAGINVISVLPYQYPRGARQRRRATPDRGRTPRRGNAAWQRYRSRVPLRTARAADDRHLERHRVHPPRGVLQLRERRRARSSGCSGLVPPKRRSGRTRSRP